MQGTDRLTEEDEDNLALIMAGIDPETAYCSTTNRIVIISPLPQRVHELVRELTSACYDVLVFHYAEPALLPQLRADLLIADETRLEEGADREWIKSAEAAGLSLLKLVDPAREAAGQSGEALEWPCSIEEALAKVRSIMENKSREPGSSKPAEEGLLQLKDLTLDLKRYVVSVKNGRIDLTKTEFDLLRAILSAEGSVLSRQELMDRVWGEGYFGGSNTVDVHVKTLRQKLHDDPRNPVYIATVRGIGYRAAD